jgi:hypothetical protein
LQLLADSHCVTDTAAFHYCSLQLSLLTAPYHWRHICPPQHPPPPDLERFTLTLLPPLLSNAVVAKAVIATAADTAIATLVASCHTPRVAVALAVALESRGAEMRAAGGRGMLLVARGWEDEVTRPVGVAVAVVVYGCIWGGLLRSRRWFKPSREQCLNTSWFMDVFGVGCCAPGVG